MRIAQSRSGVERTPIVVTLEVIDDLARWIELGPEWQYLEASVPHSTPFQTSQWQLTWWRHFGSGGLRVFILRDGEGTMVGLVPCFLHQWEGRRQLTLIGSGISDYLEPAIAPAFCQEIVDCFRDHLVATRDWDICSWQDLSSGTPLCGLGSSRCLRVRCQPDSPCSAIAIEKSFAEFWAGRPSGLRRNVRRYREKAEQVATLEFDAAPYERECLEALIRLHSARWREQGQPGMISANRSAGFLIDVAEAFRERQMLWFFSLRFQAEIVAVIMAFDYRNVLYGYLSAFDPSYADFGFGRILLFHSLRYAFERRYASWNFLRGSEPYKSDWGAVAIPKSRLEITRPGD